MAGPTTRLPKEAGSCAFALAMCVLGAVVLAATAFPVAQTPAPDAASVIAAAREALGGDKRAAVKTIVTTGRTRQVRGDNLVPIEFPEMTSEVARQNTSARMKCPLRKADRRPSDSTAIV